MQERLRLFCQREFMPRDERSGILAGFARTGQWGINNEQPITYVVADSRRHVLPTLGGDDPSDTTVYVAEGGISQVGLAQMRAFPELAWREVHDRRGRVISTHHLVHRELAGTITTTRCQFCELSMLRLDDDCVRFVLRGLAHNKSATPVTVPGLVSDWAIGARRFFKTTYNYRRLIGAE